MSLFGAFVPYWFVFQIVLGVPVVFDEGDGDGYPDYNTFQTLESLGDKIFGEPRPSSGELELFLAGLLRKNLLIIPG